MFKIRLTFAIAALFTTAMTTVVTVVPQPGGTRTIACSGQLDEPARA